MSEVTEPLLGENSLTESFEESDDSSSESSDSLIDISDEYSFNDIPSDSEEEEEQCRGDEEISREVTHPSFHVSNAKDLSVIVEESYIDEDSVSDFSVSVAESYSPSSSSHSSLDTISVSSASSTSSSSDDSDLLQQILTSINMSQYSTLDWSGVKDIQPEKNNASFSKLKIVNEEEKVELKSPEPVERSYTPIPTVSGSLPNTVPVIRNHLADILVRNMCGPDSGEVHVKRTPVHEHSFSKLPLTSTPNQTQPESADTEKPECPLPQEQVHTKKTPERDSKKSKRREKIMQEIIDSERTYQNHLYLTVKCFEFPLRKAAVLPEEVISSIFGNVRQILSLNQELLTKLEDGHMGSAFLQMAPFLKLYSMYANNHEKALATLLEWDQKCPEFGTFRRQQEDLAEMNGLKLNALLITPVQRVPRYKLLLTDLLENTSADHEDYLSLSEAVHLIAQVANHINDHIKQQDNFKRMLQIQKSLSGAAAPRLLAPGRLIVKEGTLKKVSRKAGRSHDRFFYLFSDMLMYTKPRLLEGSVPQSQGQICCCVFPLAHVRLMRVFGAEAGQGEGALFSIHCKDQSVLLYSDHETVNEWMKVINRTIREYKENRKSLRKSSISSSHNSPFPCTPISKTKSSNHASISSPTSTLKRVFAENDVNCLSPKKSKDVAKKLWARSKSFTSINKKSCSDIHKTPDSDPRKRRYPSTPSALDGLDQHEIIDLDETEVWHQEQSTMSTVSLPIGPSQPSINAAPSPHRPLTKPAAENGCILQ